MSQLALQLIQENIKKHERGEDATYLDLGNCNLSTLPKEIGKLLWLETLILSTKWFEYTANLGPWQKITSKNDGKPNRIRSLEGIQHLISLKKLVVAKEYENDTDKKKNWPINDLKPLANLKQLQQLFCSSTQVCDLTPLAKITDLQQLFCESTQVGDLTPLANLTQLQQLDCSDTQVSSLTPLAGLTQLQHLFCSSTQVSDLTPLVNLTQLQQLSCSSTQVSDLTPLANLTQLQRLLCYSTQVSDLSPLANLTQLKQLSCTYTQVSDLTPLANLTQLQQLDCFSTQVSDLTPLANLTRLQHLDCSDTQISDLTPLANLTQLQQLNCFSTQVSDLTPLANLTQLQQLFCFSTQVSDLTPLANLTHLQYLECSSTQITDLSPILHLIQRKLVYSFQNCLLDITLQARLSQGSVAVVSYYEELGYRYDDTLQHYIKFDTTNEYLYEGRMLLIGEPKAGKTTLRLKLEDIESPLPTESTEGIDVDLDNQTSNRFECTTPEGKTVTFHYQVWDFGGQRPYHPTHQLFFSDSSLYLLVTNTDWNKNEEDVEFWLETVQKLGANSPVIRVQNAPSNREDDSDWSDINRRFGQMIKEAFTINLDRVNPKDEKKYNEKYGREFQKLRSSIETQFKNLDHVGSKVPPVWKRIRESLSDEATKKPCITWAEFQRICGDYNDPQNQAWLSQTFHKLGICLHYERNETLRNYLILDNEWAINAVFAVLDSELLAAEESKGIFAEKDLPKIWSKPQYQGMEGQLLQLLREFELCYPIENNKRYVVPQRLRKSPPDDLVWDNTQNARVDIVFDFLPRVAITRLIVKMHKHIDANQTWVWQNGVVLDGKGLDCTETKAKLQEKHRSKAIEVRMHGPYTEGLFREIRAKVIDILEDFPTVKVDYTIYCNCEDCRDSETPTPYKYFDELMHFKYKLRQDSIQCKKNGKAIPLATIVHGIIPPQELFPTHKTGVIKKGEYFQFADRGLAYHNYSRAVEYFEAANITGLSPEPPISLSTPKSLDTPTPPTSSKPSKPIMDYFKEKPVLTTFGLIIIALLFLKMAAPGTKLDLLGGLISIVQGGKEKGTEKAAPVPVEPIICTVLVPIKINGSDRDLDKIGYMRSLDELAKTSQIGAGGIAQFNDLTVPKTKILRFELFSKEGKSLSTATAQFKDPNGNGVSNLDPLMFTGQFDSKSKSWKSLVFVINNNNQNSQQNGTGNQSIQTNQ